MDLQPDTFCLLGRTSDKERAHFIASHTDVFKAGFACNSIYRTNMRTLALLLPIPRPARSQRVFPPFVLRLFNFWPTTRTFSSWARSWGAGSVQPRDSGCRVNAASYVHALHVKRAFVLPALALLLPSKWGIDKVP